ncbi:MAG: GIY-YIG nuclease family protein [Bacteroidia bacterium]|nr:GIY-YIG nuclease family protein [Bacteroidia bacterium]
MIHDYAYVYLLGNFNRNVLYTGVTTDLKQRITDHKNGIGSSFTQKYNIHILLWYQSFERIEDAITREKQIKRWRREWKEKLIRDFNPDFKDLYFDMLEL